MARFEIKHRWTGSVLFSAEVGSLKLCVEAAVGAKASLYGANLTRANLTRANLYGASLDGANLTRANLYGANLDGANLDGANLTRASLYGANLYGASLDGASLDGANLTRANLYGASLDGTSLGAIMSDITVPSLNRQILASIKGGGSLEMSQWHTCETTHCRGGWAIHFAGSAGRVLEACLGSPTAAALIHLASCPQLAGKVPDFQASNEDALADIKRLAELEPELEAVA